MLTGRSSEAVNMQGRIVMFTDGKCTSTSVRPEFVEENFEDSESEDTVQLR